MIFIEKVINFFNFRFWSAESFRWELLRSHKIAYWFLRFTFLLWQSFRRPSYCFEYLSFILLFYIIFLTDFSSFLTFKWQAKLLINLFNFKIHFLFLWFIFIILMNSNIIFLYSFFFIYYFLKSLIFSNLKFNLIFQSIIILFQLYQFFQFLFITLTFISHLNKLSF